MDRYLSFDTVGLFEPTDSKNQAISSDKSRKQATERALKVPKRENFLLAFFAQTKPIWVCDLENKKIKNFFGV